MLRPAGIRRRGGWRPGPAAGQRGFAMPTTLWVMTLMLALMGVAVEAGIFSVGRSVDESRTKRAIQAADSGARAATYRMNVISLQRVLQSTVPCLAKATGQAQQGVVRFRATAELGDTWCPAVTEDTGNNTSFSYRVSRVEGESTISSSCAILASCNVTLTRTIVSTGTACVYGDVNCSPGDAQSTSRRVRVKVRGVVTLHRILGGLAVIDSPARFQQIEYVECSPEPGAGQTPDQGC